MTRQPGRRNRHARQDGATLVEFAIVMPFALLIVLCIIQIGLMYSAKQILNEGTFLAAREGSVQNAQRLPIVDAMNKALVPFYQNTSDAPFVRLQKAVNAARTDTNCLGACLEVEILNPTPEAFADFGVSSGASDGRTYIPNDNLEYRPHFAGASSGISIQDANTLKIKVTYGYELKVPLLKIVIPSIMCAVDTGINAFGRGDTPEIGTPGDCAKYYKRGRVPIVTYATVQMQTPAMEE
jgi:hypothetical protein